LVKPFAICLDVLFICLFACYKFVRNNCHPLSAISMLALKVKICGIWLLRESSWNCEN